MRFLLYFVFFQLNSSPYRQVKYFIKNFQKERKKNFEFKNKIKINIYLFKKLH